MRKRPPGKLRTTSTNEELDNSLHNPMDVPLWPFHELNYDTQKQLVDYFFISTSGFLDVFDVDEVDRYLSGVALSKRPARDWTQGIAALSLILAIGAQARASSPDDTVIESAGFAFGKTLAFQAQLDNPEIDLVRLFLLMAFLMMGSSRSHAGILYIGIAATTSLILGLHRTERYAELPQGQRSLYWRAYRSLVLMDIFYATVTGRHTLTHMPTSGIPYVDDGFSATAISFELCRMIYTAVNTVASTGRLEMDEAIELKQSLIEQADQWKESQQLNSITVTRMNSSNQEGRVAAAGQLQASCIHYHLLVLITRPILIRSIVPLAKSASTDSALNLAEVLDEMALLCIDASIFIIQVCHCAFETDLLSGNMCHIIRPLLFEAGLVLGFVLAFYPNDSSDIEDEFQTARKLLEHFASTSLLSRVFYKILTSLLDVIIERRNKSLNNELLGSESIQRLFQFDLHHGGEGQDSSQPVLPSSEGHSPQESDFQENRSYYEYWHLFAQQL